MSAMPDDGPGYYLLHPDHSTTRVPRPSWRWQTDDERRVAQDYVDRVRISTVFVGVDHRVAGEGPPLLFETWIFGGELDQEHWRWSTWNEAKRGHALVVELVRARESARDG